MPKERFKIIVAVYFLLLTDGKVLLQRRFNTGYRDGQYGVPAGHLEDKEFVMDTAIREAKEEIGITFDPKDARLVHIIHKTEKDALGNKDNRLNIFIEVSRWKGEPKIMEPDKSDDLQWFNLENLPSNIIPYIKHALEQIKSKKVYSELAL